MWTRALILQGAVLDEVAALKAALALEREERIAEDDEIVQVSTSPVMHDAQMHNAYRLPPPGAQRVGYCLSIPA
jgi:hypothetical protein